MPADASCARCTTCASTSPVEGDRELRARSLAVGLYAALARAAVGREERLLPEYLRGLLRATS